MTPDRRKLENREDNQGKNCAKIVRKRGSKWREGEKQQEVRTGHDMTKISRVISMNQQKAREDLRDFGFTNCWREISSLSHTCTHTHNRTNTFNTTQQPLEPQEPRCVRRLTANSALTCARVDCNTRDGETDAAVKPY